MSQQLLGLSDVAALAQVDRPLVSMWRHRRASSDNPFPAPVRRRGGRDLFDAAEVARWLTLTGLGKNVSALDDVALFALLRGEPADRRSEAITAVSALLALAAASRSGLAELDAGQLLDLADDVDPFDLALYSEIKALGDRRAEWAARTEAVIGAAYTPWAAFRALLGSAEVRADLGTTAGRVSPLLAEFLARVASHEMSPQAVMGSVPLPGAVLDLAAAWEDVERPPLRVPEGAGQAERFMRCAAMAAGWVLGRAEDGTGSTTGVAQMFDADVADALARVSELSVTMRDGDRWVVVGTATALVGGLTGTAADVRADVLRTGRLRAVVLLPAGLRPAHPREQLAVWVLGDAPQELSLTDRWTSVSDLSGERWTADVVEDLFSDVTAALAGPRAVRAHASRFARVVATAELAAANTMLARTGERRRRARSAPADVALEVSSVVERLAAPVPRIEVVPWQSGGSGARVTTLGSLVDRGAVQVVRGCRLAAEEVGHEPGVTVLGRPEVRGGVLGARTVDRLRLVAEHPSFRYTEPGDVVVTTDVPGAVVDDDGLSIIEYPARGLRLAGSATGLTPHVLVSAVRTARPGSPWRSWPVVLAPPDQAGPLEDVLASVERVRAELMARLAAADALRSTLTSGVADGSITLTPTVSSAEMSR